MEIIRILIVDDHQLILNGITEMLKSLKRYKIVGWAMNGLEAVEKANLLKPDIIFMDISMPVMNGLEATKRILQQLPATKILALTQHEENEYVVQMLKSGVCGYLLKNSKKEEFNEAIESVLKGNKYFSQEISDQLINQMVTHHSSRDEKDSKEVHLTNREKEVIQKIANDMSNQQIADELHISLRTVETHRRNIMQKLKVKTVVALLKYATQHKLISFD